MQIENNVLKSVEKSDANVINHLFKSFGSDIICLSVEDKKSFFPKTFYPIRVLYPLECALTQDGSQMTVIKPGTYLIASIGLSGDVVSASLRKPNKNESGNTKIFIEWEDQMIDWRGIVPAGKS